MKAMFKEKNAEAICVLYFLEHKYNSRIKKVKVNCYRFNLTIHSAHSICYYLPLAHSIIVLLWFLAVDLFSVDNRFKMKIYSFTITLMNIQWQMAVILACFPNRFPTYQYLCNYMNRLLLNYRVQTLKKTWINKVKFWPLNRPKFGINNSMSFIHKHWPFIG